MKTSYELLGIRWNKHRLGQYFLGCSIFSLGAKCFINSRLGVDPLDTLTIGLTMHGIPTIGIASGLVAIAFLAWWSIWNRQYPPLTPFLTTFLVGNLIDLWNWIDLRILELRMWNAYALLVIGLILCGQASALIIMSGIGIRIMDLVAISIVKKWKISFFAAKISLEVFLLGSGAALGGPVGVGTLLFILCVGPFIQIFMYWNTKLFRWHNYGMSSPEPTTSS